MWGLALALLGAVGLMSFLSYPAVQAAVLAMTFLSGWYTLGACFIGVLYLTYFITLTATTVAGIDLTKHALGNFVFSVLHIERRLDTSIPGMVRMTIRYGLAVLGTRVILVALGSCVVGDNAWRLGIGLAAIITAIVLSRTWSYRPRMSSPVRQIPNIPPSQ